MKSLLAVFLCAAAAATANADTPAVASAPIPIEEFTRTDEFGMIEISPDGEHIAATTGRNGSGALAFINLRTKAIVGGVRMEEPHEIDEFHWVSPTRVIYTVAERYPGRTFTVATGEIFGIDVDGKAHKQIYGYRGTDKRNDRDIPLRDASYATPELLSVLKNDPRHILIAEYPWRKQINHYSDDPDAKPRVVLLDVYSGIKKTLEEAPLANAGLLVDRNDVVRFAIGRNADVKLRVSWKPEADSPWTDFDLPDFRDETVVPREFSADNQSVYFTGVRRGETLAALYRLDLQSRQPEKVHAFKQAEVDGVILDFASREIVGVRGYVIRPVFHWLNENDPAAQLRTALQRAFVEQDVEITSTTEDGRLAVAFVHSDRNPGDYYLFDTASKRASHLRSTRSWVDPKKMRPKDPIELTARDGTPLRGYLTLPEGDGPHPMVVLPHGGPHGVRDDWSYDWKVQLLASRGYAVLQVNFRGSSGYGVDFQIAGYRQWGAKMQDDLTDATRWAIERKVTTEDRVCIFGASYGGYAALMGVVREPTLYRCAIGFAGVYDLELMFDSADIPDSKSGLAYLTKVLGTDPNELHARSPVYNADRIQVPVLLIHGNKDWRADFEQGKRMKAALDKGGKQVEWMALSGEGHGIFEEQTRREVYERVLQFLDRNLKPTLSASK